MSEKLNIQDLIELLAERHGMSKKNADSFVKEFFLLIEESLEKDKYVKIKGLGAFKLIDVEKRESINVNTGDRFEIQGHTKVSFTPEPILKELINKPFAHFETVILNENTQFDEISLDNESEEEEDLKTSERKKQTIEVVDEQPIALSKEVSLVQEVLQKPIEIPLIENETLETLKEAPVVSGNTKKADIEKPIETTLNEDTSKPHELKSADSSVMKYFIGTLIFVIIVCSGTVAFLYYPDLLYRFLPVSSTEETTKTPPDNNHRVASPDSIAKSTTEPIKMDTMEKSIVDPKLNNISQENILQPVAQRKQAKPAVPFEPDSVGYTIVGTETIYTIQEGETLTRIALRFYGTKALWPYIVRHNPEVIKNPDNIPYGTVIKIPKLTKKQ